MNILIIDDDRFLRRALSHSLMEAGHYDYFISKPIDFDRLNNVVDELAAAKK